MKKTKTTRIQQNNENLVTRCMGSNEPPRLQGYCIRECLGGGGMRSVWRVEHEMLDREFDGRHQGTNFKTYPGTKRIKETAPCNSWSQDRPPLL